MTPDPALVEALRSALGPDAVLVPAEACAPFECDALNTQRRRPEVVALPRSAEQVMAVLRACRRHGTPVADGFSCNAHADRTGKAKGVGHRVGIGIEAWIVSSFPQHEIAVLFRRTLLVLAEELLC